jgi:hypothetical protein
MGVPAFGPSATLTMNIDMSMVYARDLHRFMQEADVTLEEVARITRSTRPQVELWLRSGVPWHPYRQIYIFINVWAAQRRGSYTDAARWFV